MPFDCSISCSLLFYYFYFVVCLLVDLFLFAFYLPFLFERQKFELIFEVASWSRMMDEKLKFDVYVTVMQCSVSE